MTVYRSEWKPWIFVVSQKRFFCDVQGPPPRIKGKLFVQPQRKQENIYAALC